MPVFERLSAVPRLEEVPRFLRHLIAKAGSQQPLEIILDQLTFDVLYAAASQEQGFSISGWDGAKFDGIPLLIRPGAPRIVEVREKAASSVIAG